MSLTKIPTRQLGKNGPFVSAVGLGTMTIAGAFYGKADPAEIIRVLDYAANRGVTFWDCANIYTGAEEFLGEWFTSTGRRSEIFLCTKFGGGTVDPVSWEIHSEPSHIRKSIQLSLSKLKTTYVDLYYQHRVDPKVPIEVVIETIGEFIEKGQIKYIGLSECSIDTLRRARAVPVYGEKVIAVQMEFSPFFLDIEKMGFVKVAEELGIGIVAYSPLGRGLMTGRFRSRADLDKGDWRMDVPRFSDENFPKVLKVVDSVAEIAKKYPGATPAQVTLAWILAEHKTFIPLPSGRTVERIEDNARSSELKLDAADVKKIREISEAMDDTIRYPLPVLERCMLDSLPLDQWKGE